MQSTDSNPADFDVEASGRSKGSSIGAITPRSKRDPSPLELGLLKSRSIESQVQQPAAFLGYSLISETDFSTAWHVDMSLTVSCILPWMHSLQACHYCI